MRDWPEDKDESEAYDTDRQRETDRCAEQLALAKTRRAPFRGGLTAGLLQHFAAIYENLQSRGAKGRVQKGTGKAES